MSRIAIDPAAIFVVKMMKGDSHGPRLYINESHMVEYDSTEGAEQALANLMIANPKLVVSPYFIKEAK